MGCTEPQIVDCGAGFAFALPGGATACAYCYEDLVECPDGMTAVMGMPPYCLPRGEPDEGVAGLAQIACARCGPAPARGEVIGAVSAGDDHLCALIEDLLYCWGSNEYGQIGLPESVESCPAPQRIGVSRPFRLMTTGADHTCAQQASDHQVFCFGENTYGQLGRTADTFLEQSDPEQGTLAPDGRAFDLDLGALAGGLGFTCGIRPDRSVVCWGLFPPVHDDELATVVPVNPESRELAGASALAQTICLRAADGRVICWGSNQNGEGSGGATTLLPAGAATIDSLPGAPSEVSTGDLASCAVAGGTVHCWGRNKKGALGNGRDETGIVATPEAVHGMPGAVDVCVGRGHACLVSAEGTVSCWGDGELGQLANRNAGPTNFTAVPVEVADLGGVVEVECGADYTCAIAADRRELWCWGDNEIGFMGDVGEVVTRPVQVL